MAKAGGDTKGLYTEGDPEISQEAKGVLVDYSGIPENEVLSHVRQLVSPSSCRQTLSVQTRFFTLTVL